MVTLTAILIAIFKTLMILIGMFLPALILLGSIIGICYGAIFLSDYLTHRRSK